MSINMIFDRKGDTEKRTIKYKSILCVLIMTLFLFCGCDMQDHESKEESFLETAYQGSMSLRFAKHFTVDYYEGGYILLTTTVDSKRFLLVPENAADIDNLPDDVTVLHQPVQDIYLVASAVMDMFCQLESLNAVSLSGKQEEGWYIEEAREAMKSGNLVYAGKYNKPDYELILSKGCQLAIENRMITHSPEVMEKLEEFSIPVIVEYSSYEEHPLGRVEWIKFFGALLGKSELAEEIFERQVQILDMVSADEKTEKSVAFFYITSTGMAQVRCTTDYIPKMIALAGGNYVFDETGGEEQKRSTINMQMEDFYKKAKDADYLIYNSAIDGGIRTKKELIAKSSLLADFKAVIEDNVFCTTNDLYQQSMAIGDLMKDIHIMLKDEDGKDNKDRYMCYLYQLD